MLTFINVILPVWIINRRTVINVTTWVFPVGTKSPQSSTKTFITTNCHCKSLQVLYRLDNSTEKFCFGYLLPNQKTSVGTPKFHPFTLYISMHPCYVFCLRKISYKYYAIFVKVLVCFHTDKQNSAYYKNHLQMPSLAQIVTPKYVCQGIILTSNYLFC